MYEVKRNKRGRLVIEAGLVHGVVTGTRFFVYADRNFEPGSSPIATVRAVEVSAFTSKLKQEEISSPGTGVVLDRASSYFAVQDTVGKTEALRFYVDSVQQESSRIWKALRQLAHVPDANDGPAIVFESDPTQAILGAHANAGGMTYTIHDPLITSHGLSTLDGMTTAGN